MAKADYQCCRKCDRKVVYDSGGDDLGLLCVSCVDALEAQLAKTEAWLRDDMNRSTLFARMTAAEARVVELEAAARRVVQMPIAESIGVCCQGDPDDSNCPWDACSRHIYAALDALDATLKET